jgi:hypothetical protein
MAVWLPGVGHQIVDFSYPLLEGCFWRSFQITPSSFRCWKKPLSRSDLKRKPIKSKQTDANEQKDCSDPFPNFGGGMRLIIELM